MNSLSCACVAAAALWLSPVPAPAPAPLELEFPRASPACKLEQRIGLTDVALAFGRPSARGRKVFGGLEPYGEVWRTGANEATTIRFSAASKFGGADVPAGTYALFSIPGEQEWTVILNKKSDQWGAYGYDAAQDQVRVQAKPQALALPVETFAMGFSDLHPAAATLYFEWERVRVPVAIESNVVATLVPQIQKAIAEDEKKPYFPAAMFYFENGLDLKQAAEWMSKAVAEQPDALWMIYRQGLILEKLGDKPGALAAAKRSLELASKAKGPIKDEYTRLNQALIDRLR